MNTKEAVVQRIVDLCAERNIAVNAIANISGVAPSTVYSMLNTKSQNPGVVSIKKLYDGLDRYSTSSARQPSYNKETE